MKHLILFLFSICISFMLHAQVSKTVNITPGGLSAALTPTELNTVTNLTVKGYIDARDFKTMRDNMPLLAVIDLSGAAVTAYSNYPANSIPYDSFYDYRIVKGKTSLKTFIFPSLITTIGQFAFAGCSGLTGSLNIPSSVTSIGPSAFSACSKLTSVTIPSSVTTIGSSAFAGCSGLTGSLNIPSSVTSIDYAAFQNCSGLTSIYSNSSYPVELSRPVFDGVNKNNCILYVPYGSRDIYAAANEWKGFTNIIAEMHGFLLGTNTIKLAATEGSNATISMKTNVAWTAISDQNWLIISPSTSNVNQQTVTFTAEANPSDKPRFAIVTISANGVESQTVIVRQQGLPVLIEVDDVPKDYTSVFLPEEEHWYKFKTFAQGDYIINKQDNVWEESSGEIFVYENDPSGLIINKIQSVYSLKEATWYYMKIVGVSRYHLNILSGINHLEIGNPLNAAIEVEGEGDWFTFYAPQGCDDTECEIDWSCSWYVILKTSGNTDTHMYLYSREFSKDPVDDNPSFYLRTENDNNGIDLNAKIIAHRLSHFRNAFYVKVKGANSSVTGPYSIDASLAVGNPEVYSSSSTTANHMAVPISFCMENISINNLSIYHNGGTGKMLLGVYSGGGVLLGVTEPTDVSPTEGWQTVNLINPFMYNYDYGELWLTFIFENNPGVRCKAVTGKSVSSSDTWGAGMPGTFGTKNFIDSTYSIYCSFTTIQSPATVLNVSPSVVQLGNNPVASNTFNITSNSSWNITDDANWLDVTPVSGTNNGTITVTANSENTGTNPRTATITITGSGFVKIVTVTQNSGPNLDKTSGNMDIFALTTQFENLHAIPVTFGEDGLINSVSIYHNGGTGNVLLGVYSDLSGLPASRLGVTAPTVINSMAGWQTVSLGSPVSVTSGQTIWLAWVFENMPGIRYTPTTGNTVTAESTSWWLMGGIPPVFGLANLTNYTYSIYCTYTPVINMSPTYSEYLFEESAGTTVIDSKGPNNGTIINNAARVDGAEGGGLEFTGTEYITLGQSFGENVENEVTLSAWIKPATTGVFQGVIMHGGPNIDTYALYIRPDSKEIAFKTSGTTNDWISIKNVANLWDGNWHQLAVTYNGTQKVIYLDSVAIITVDATGTIESGAGYNLLIGAGRDTESPTLLYKGLIDEVRIYNYALTGSQIADLYNLIDTNPPTLTLSKTSLEFTSSSGDSTVNITSNVNWTASDDAAWLTVSPASGSNNGTVTITASSANTTATPRTGTVTVTGSGISRTVTVTQNGVCQPGWVVVTSTNTTTAYCKVTIEGIPASADDKLGVFVGNECRGIGNIVMNNNEAYSTIMIQGISPETVGFRIWDASECSELMACGTFTTNPGGSVGNPPNYLIVNVCTDKTQALNLIGGWNLASLYVNTEAKSPKQIFGGSSCIAQVKNMTKSWDPSVPDFLNTLQVLSKGEGYFIKTKNACNIEVTGPYIGNEHSINLISGWNLIGYPYDICQPGTSGIKTLLDNNKVVQLKNMTQSYDPLVPDFLNTLKYLSPGEGYFLKASSSYNNFILTEPTVCTKSTSVTEHSVCDWQFTGYEKSTIAYGEITLNNLPVTGAAYIGAFAGEECRSVIPLIQYEGKSYASMVINGDEQEQIKFRLCVGGKVYESKTVIHTNPGESMKSVIPIPFNNFGDINQGPELTTSPNPFSQNLEIKVRILNDDDITIRIYNTESKLIKTFKVDNAKAGSYKFNWDATDLSGNTCVTGMYFIQLQGKTGSAVQKVILDR